MHDKWGTPIQAIAREVPFINTSCRADKYAYILIN